MARALSTLSASCGSLADKVDNARAIAADYRLLGKLYGPLQRWQAEINLWYYRSLVEVIGTARPPDAC